MPACSLKELVFFLENRKMQLVPCSVVIVSLLRAMMDGSSLDVSGKFVHQGTIWTFGGLR